MQLRIEIWMDEKIEWSSEGDGTAEQLRFAGLKIPAYFPDDKINLVLDKDNVTLIDKKSALNEVIDKFHKHNVMLCDTSFNTMMVFIWDVSDD